MVRIETSWPIMTIVNVGGCKEGLQKPLHTLSPPPAGHHNPPFALAARRVPPKKFLEFICDKMAARFDPGQRVTCLAYRFNDETPDADGKFFSDHHHAKTNDTFVYGTVKRMLKRPYNTFKVLFDGDSKQSKSSGNHLTAVPSSDSDGSSEDECDEDEASDENSDGGSDGEMNRTLGMSAEEIRHEEEQAGQRHEDDEAYASEGAPDTVEEGWVSSNNLEVHGHTWKRKASIATDPRGAKGRPTTSFKHLPVTFETTELGIFEELMPVDWAVLLKRVQARATFHGDGSKFRERDVRAWMALSIGSTQFKPGTDFWSTTPVGLIPAINWGRHLSRDRYLRITRYLSEAAPLPDGDLDRDRWRDVTWMIEAFNKSRKMHVKPGWLLCVDESMIAWTGNGCPHLSYVPRKPEPLGIEIKNLCDATSGVMLFLEIQDNKEMMARKKYRSGFPAAIATTLRLLGSVSEKRVLLPADRVERLVAMDSWFASVSCVKALWATHKVRSIGNVKTATRCYPHQEMRWKLSRKERGAIDVMHCQDHEVWALGWHDHYFKTFVCNAGTSEPGEPAKKKRQRDDGSNYFKLVDRPVALQHFYDACGSIDQHNRHRQHLLKLEKIWRTHRWQTRVLYAVMVGMVTVDAHLMCAHLLPDRNSDTKESMAGFVAKLVAQMLPDEIPGPPSTESPAVSVMSTPSSEGTTPGASSAAECYLEKIGSTIIGPGHQNAGKKRPTDSRCCMCITAKRRAVKKDGTSTGRAPKTIWRCGIHPDVPICHTHASNCLGEHIHNVNFENMGL